MTFVLFKWEFHSIYLGFFQLAFNFVALKNRLSSVCSSTKLERRLFPHHLLSLRQEKCTLLSHTGPLSRITKLQIMSPSIRKGRCGLKTTFSLTNPEVRVPGKFVL